MSQHDMDLANAAGASFRADLNLALVALVGQNSGAAAPATTFAYQFWADTTTGWLKQRNAANSAWIYVQPLAGHAEAALASATTTDLGAQVSDAVLISGTTTITGFGTADAGRIVKVRHSGALTLTHNGTSLILPGAANITTAAGDTYDAESLGSGNWVVRAYQKASGLAVVASANIKLAGDVEQVIEGTPYTAYGSTATAIPADDTIPQNTEGAEWVTATITPKSASNRLLIECFASQLSGSAVLGAVGALFQDTTANALAAGEIAIPAINYRTQLSLKHEMAAGTTSATTFKFRMGPTSGTLYVNGAGARVYGGVSSVRIRITEIKV